MIEDELPDEIEIELDDRGKALEAHSERPKRERIADESFRAQEVTEDFERWKQAPGRLDFEGVDTVARRIRRRRTNEALAAAKDRGLVEEVVEAESDRELPGENPSSTARGVHSPGAEPKIGLRVDKLGEEQRTETLAHEVGHAIDFGQMATSASMLDGLGLGDNDPLIASEQALDTVGSPAPDDDQVAEEVRGVSERRRGEISEYAEDYREKPTELFADFFADAITRPRHTKARAPETFDRVDEELQDAPEELEPSRRLLRDDLGLL